MPGEAKLSVEKSGAVATLVLNRPEALNVFNRDLLKELHLALLELAQDQGVRVVILTGAGNRAFSAGADVREMRDLSPSAARDYSRLGHELTLLIEHMEKPVIAALNGLTLGGGCEVALACDLRIASDRARLGQPEVGLSIIPGWGGTQRLARLIGPARAREMIFTGKIVDATEARLMGLVNAVVPGDALLEECRKLATTIAEKGPLAVGFAKRAINYGLETDLATGLALETDLFGLLFATEDQREGMAAFLEKRAPQFQGR